MSKKLAKKLLLSFILIPLVIAVAAFIWWNQVTQAPSGNASITRFIVDEGDGATRIANKLYQQKLIKSPLAFKFYVQLTGKAKNIPAGEFEIAKNLNMFEVLNKLSGKPLELKVTIPEGLRIEEIPNIFIKRLDIPQKAAELFRTEFLAAAKEGYMYPETYYFQPDTTGGQAAKRMKEQFDNKVTNGLKNQISTNKLKLDEIITLASIVERETRTAEERPVVAGILLNRLDIGMALQADATAQYAASNVRCRNRSDCDWWVPPTLEDLAINSPYNTYKFAGLPPAPIGSPGLSSIEAVIDPAKTDYLYYIHDKNGLIHYAKTLQEHNANIAKYLNR